MTEEENDDGKTTDNPFSIVNNDTKPEKNTRYDAARRHEIGRTIKSLRQAAQLTQSQFAKLVGQEYLSMVSQVETGRVRLPAQDTELWARILGADVQAFAKECVRCYEPEGYYRAIYGKAGISRK